MAIYSKILELINGQQKTVDLSSNTLAVGSIQIAGNLLSSSTPGSSGSMAVGDDNSYSNFTPASPTVKAALQAIDSALAGSVSGHFSDASFDIYNVSDNTKIIKFSAAGIATATTRTITMPNFNVDLGNLDNNNIAAAAGIVYSKLSLSNSIVNADINSAAAIAYSKLNLASSIVNADIASGAAIAYSKLNLSNSVVAGDLNSGAATLHQALFADGSGNAAYRSLVAADIPDISSTYQVRSEKGAANGYAGLDGSGKVPYSQLPSALMTYKGAWDPTSLGSPLTTLDASPLNGDVYRASVDGVAVAGNGAVVGTQFYAGDFAIYNGSAWERSPLADGVISVNGSTGAVTVNAINQLTGDVTAGPASGSQSKVATIAAGAVTASKLGTVTDGITLDQSGAGSTLEVKTGGISNAQINSAAAIDFSKLASLSSGNILVGSAGNVATSVAMSGEASIVASGAVTLSNAAVIGKVLTGYVSGAGTITSADSILSAIEKLDGNSGNFATRALDNLASVAINTSLLPASDNAINVGSSSLQFASAFIAGVIESNIAGDTSGNTGFTIKTKDTSASTTGNVFVRSGNNTGGAGTFSGQVILRSGTASVAGGSTAAVTVRVGDITASSGAGTTGQLTLRAGNIAAGGTGATGAIVAISGNNSGSGVSGSASFGSGTAVAGNSGQSNFTSGNVSGAGNSGAVILKSGNNSSTGNSGNVVIQSGTVVSGTRGNVAITGSGLFLDGLGAGITLSSSDQIHQLGAGTVSTDAINLGQLTGAGGDMIKWDSGISALSVDLATSGGLSSTNPGNAAGQLQINVDAKSININGSNQLAVLSAPLAQNTFVAGEAFAANTSFAVRFAISGETAGRVYKADKDATSSNKYAAIGIAMSTSSVSAGGNINVIMLGSSPLGSSDSAFSSGNVGQELFVGSSGAFILGSSLANTTGEAAFCVGVIQSTSSIWVDFKQLRGIA